jgi:uncharacterized protein YkwD
VKFIIFFAIVIFGLALFLPQGSATLSKPAPKQSLSREKLWEIIQKWRVSQNLSKYIEAKSLCKIAEQRVVDLKGKSGDNFNHSLFLKRYSTLPYKVSENITGGFSEKAILSSWLESSSHRKALKSDWKYSCVAVGKDYAVQIFSNL